MLHLRTGSAAVFHDKQSRTDYDRVDDLTCDGDAFSLAALALAPEEVVRRAKSPELIGTDTTKDIAGSDE